MCLNKELQNKFFCIFRRFLYGSATVWKKQGNEWTGKSYRNDSAGLYVPDCFFEIGCMEPTRKYVDDKNDGYDWGKVRFQFPT